jgi:diguanylate cyclase (GGDEF)-like protein
LTELDALPPDVARKLVDTLFHQTASIVGGASVFIVLGLVGFVGTGSPWYLAYTTGMFLWRFWQTRRYQRAPDAATLVVWAWRSIRSGWATAAGWGAWSFVVLYEPDTSIVMMVLGMHAGLVAGGAVRNCAVRAVASGQIILAAVPLFCVCVASGNPYLHVYAGIVAMHLVAALTLTRFLRRQTLQLLLSAKEKSDLVDRLEVANQELETLVATDALTGVANRRAFDLTANREWRRAAREAIPLALLMIDVDHFKAFNDCYGHPAGDACLQEVAATIASMRRPADVVARYGGEEFAVILPATDLAGAVQVGSNILTALAARNLAHNASVWGTVTVSIGAACLRPSSQTVLEHLIQHADAALYQAKRGGRNRVHAGVAQVAVDAMVSGSQTVVSAGSY